MSTVSYFTRSLKKGDKEIAIWVRIHHCGQDIRLSLHLSLPAKYWSKKRGCIRDVHLEEPYIKVRMDKINTILNNLKHHIYTIIVDSEKISSSTLRYEIRNVLNQSCTSERKADNDIFCNYISGKILSMEHKSFLNRGEPYSKNAIDNWKKFLTLWKAFELKTYNKYLSFSDIDMNTYYNFMEYCDSNMYKKSTKYQYARIFKAAMNYALNEGISANRIHLNRNFSTHASTEASKGVYLTMEEILKLGNIEFDRGDFRDKVRDYFLVGCFTGLRFSDCSSITLSDIVHFEVNGSNHSALIKRQKKTKNEVAIPLLTEDVERILMKYGGRMPRISISGYNKYIKEICHTAGIVGKIRITSIVGGKEVVRWISKDRLVSSHTARRTCITNLYLSGKLDLKQIRDISGHKSEQAFLRYICLSQEENIKSIFKRLVQ